MSSFDLNKVLLIGNVGKEPVAHEYGDNKSLVKFSMATNESWKNKKTGEYDSETQWHNIVCFNQFLCDVIMKHVTVGTKVYVEGASKTRTYKKDGSEQINYITEIILSMYGGDIKVLSRGDAMPDNVVTSATKAEADPFKDDMPF